MKFTLAVALLLAAVSTSEAATLRNLAQVQTEAKAQVQSKAQGCGCGCGGDVCCNPTNLDEVLEVVAAANIDGNGLSACELKQALKCGGFDLCQTGSYMDENLEEALAEIISIEAGSYYNDVLTDIEGVLSTADNGYPLEW